jgi:hypothetical protein
VRSAERFERTWFDACAQGALERTATLRGLEARGGATTEPGTPPRQAAPNREATRRRPHEPIEL